MLTIGPMTLEDIPQVMLIERECFTKPWSAEFYKRILRDSPYAKYYVLKREERLLGYLGLYFLIDEGEIHTLAVKKEYQNMGFAQLLMRQALRVSEILNIDRLFLEVRVGNSKAIHLYEKFGFEVLRIIKNYYKEPIEDAYLMKYERGQDNA